MIPLATLARAARGLVIAAVAGALTMTLDAPAATAAGANVVPDPALRECLNGEYLDQDATTAVTVAQLTALRGSVFCDDDDITLLAGVEYLTGVTTLSLAGTSVSDVSALKNLTQLEELYLYGTAVSNVSALAGLTNLQELYLTGTKVSDVSALKNLTKLDTLDLVDTRVTDVSPLRNLTRLEWLDLSGTPVADVSALRAATNLQGLDLSYTKVSDVSALAGLRRLSDLDLSYAKVANISVIARLPAVAGVCTGEPDDDDTDDSCWEFAAVGQDLTLPGTQPGTYRLPIQGTSGDPVTVRVASGPASVNNTAGTITYTGSGSVKLTWQSRATTQDSETGFAGTAKVTVTSPSTASFAKVGTPKIGGTAKVGNTVSVSNLGAWSPAPTSATYQWYRAGAAISGATKSSYSLVAADRGKKVTVRVVGKRDGYKDTLSPAATAVSVGYGTLASSKPAIYGRGVVNTTLTALPGTWTRGVTFSYQWYADGKKISGAARSSYVIPASMVGKKITVTVTGNLAGYTAKTVTSSPTAKVAKIS